MLASQAKALRPFKPKVTRTRLVGSFRQAATRTFVKTSPATRVGFGAQRFPMARDLASEASCPIIG